MDRNYSEGKKKDIIFFVGNEVEHTPAYGKKTLFVTGIQPAHEIQKHYDDNECEHIFFGANHSFDPVSEEEWVKWENLIKAFLSAGKICSLDIPIKHAESFLESVLVEFYNFIPQLRVPIPYIKQWNYNTMIKIDDKGFNKSNPGVWTHSLHDLMDRDKFTDWKDYGLDKII